jgi:hypothetical protein
VPAVVLDHHLLNGHGIMTLIAFQDGGPVFRDGKVGTGEDCCCPCWRENVFPITVTISNYAQAPGFFGSPDCDCYEGTYTIDELDTVYTTNVCSPSPDFTDATITVQAYELEVGQQQRIEVKVCQTYKWLGNVVARCHYYHIPRDATTLLFNICAVFFVASIPEFNWGGCVGDIEISF